MKRSRPDGAGPSGRVGTVQGEGARCGCQRAHRGWPGAAGVLRSDRLPLDEQGRAATVVVEGRGPCPTLGPVAAVASAPMGGVVTGADGVARCWWCASDPLYVTYHDTEWGWPVCDDQRLFEKLCLEGFQAGLSWLTILRKRDAFRDAFQGFDIERVAAMTDADIARLADDARIIRHEGKIASVVNNARRALAVIEEVGSLARFVWQFVPPSGERPARMDQQTLLGLDRTPTSTALSRALKRRGFTYVGPVSAYAFMQAMGVVNDHLDGCDVGARVAASRS